MSRNKTLLLYARVYTYRAWMSVERSIRMAYECICVRVCVSVSVSSREAVIGACFKNVSHEIFRISTTICLAVIS